MDTDEELFKGWPVCAGWLTEVCTYGMDLMTGTSSISEKTAKFRMEPICNQHTGEPGNNYVSEQFWIALVKMFGFVTEDGGEVSYDPKSVKPDMISWDRMLNNETENSLNRTRIIMAYISGHNHFTWTRIPIEKSLPNIVEEIKKLTKVLLPLTGLPRNDEDVRIEAANHLGNSGDERAIEPLIEALKNNAFYKFVRPEAARALGILSNELGDKRAVVPLIKALKDDDRRHTRCRSVRSSAASSLGEIGDERAVVPLIEALKDDDEGVRSSAASALGEIGDERAVEPLIKALKDNGEYVASSAARALGEIGDERAVEPLIEALKDDDESVRRWAAWSLGEIANDRCIEPLIKVLKDDDPDVRKWTTRALGKTNDIRAVEHLIEALKDDDEDLRKIAAKALGEIGDERAIEPLIDALMKIKGKKSEN